MYRPPRERDGALPEQKQGQHPDRRTRERVPRANNRHKTAARIPRPRTADTWFAPKPPLAMNSSHLPTLPDGTAQALVTAAIVAMDRIGPSRLA